MVGLFKALLPSLLFATFTAAQNLFNISVPSSNNWWVGKSQNVMVWDCKNSQAIAASEFTVLISNVDQNVLSGELAFIAIQKNADCSANITPAELNQSPAPGYILTFANVMNSSDVYATSEEFEIKPLGSLYPSQVSSSASAASGTSTAASSSASASSKNGATLSSNSPSFLGLAGIMGLLTAGLLGA